MLSASDQSELMKRFPPVELSYETVHKKVLPGQEEDDYYDVSLAIPYGKKSFLWCTYWHDQDVCLLLDLGRDRRVVNMQVFAQDIPHPWVYGTVLYGVVVLDRIFVVEDILMSRGILLHKQPFGERLPFFREMMESWGPDTIRLPCMCKRGHRQGPSDFCKRGGVPVPPPPYVVHHIQHRSLSQIVPYMNESSMEDEKMTAEVIEEKAPRCDFKKPQYKKPTVFYVKADVQYDIYRLYVMDRSYYGLAYIPNYKTSAMMNGFFRTIRENRNLDLLEESDDEDDFQNIHPTKYVDLEKCLAMECVFHPKFKRWVPVRCVHSPVVSLNKL
jgi:hypothetical protein